MTTKAKIKIVDNPLIRKQIDSLYENTNQVLLARWSISIAKHIMLSVGMDYLGTKEIAEGIRVNELWQTGNARMHDVRQAGFKVHKLARMQGNDLDKTVLRVVGQAIGSGHMREHSIIASDYAIKVIGMMYKDNLDEITRERMWQLEELKKVINE